MQFPLLSLLLLLVAATPQLASAQDCKACLFDGNDPEDCIIYGKVGDQVVEWSTANRECKGWYQIAITSLDPTTSCMSTNAFVNSLRFGDLQNSDSKLGLGVGSDGGAFFMQNPDANNRIDMVDSITIGGETTNCAASANNCWNAMKPYFESDAEGKKEKDQVCETLYNKVRVDKNLEESVLRNRLCMEHKEATNPIITDCYPLAQQVIDLVKADPARDCSAYGFETPLSSIPGCENVLKETSSGGGGSSGGGSTTSSSGGGSLSSSTSQSWAWNRMLNSVLLGMFLVSSLLL